MVRWPSDTVYPRWRPVVAVEASVNSAGSNAAAKLLSLVYGMVADADSIDDMDRLRHGDGSAEHSSTPARDQQ